MGGGGSKGNCDDPVDQDSLKSTTDVKNYDWSMSLPSRDVDSSQG